MESTSTWRHSNQISPRFILLRNTTDSDGSAGYDDIGVVPPGSDGDFGVRKGRSLDSLRYINLTLLNASRENEMFATRNNSRLSGLDFGWQ